jgi:hypothetical protein
MHGRQTRRRRSVSAERQRGDALLKLERHDQLLASSEPFDDDSLNSRIVFTAPAADTYRLVVYSNWLDESGSYSLHVRELTPHKVEQKLPN